ncbi:GNAT family N-acetyltransferase [Robertkochia sediminum]|uniref:GNAT family N-acetyltransferase n=1 Tax=Robertkochia sediminum TaxID=2785326 RepID=UPI001931CA21|nr:GNAT family N-acetyltransferase [Robertkochia sediminum]MBL7472300.1 GNAT family N-acetyltransferase [Robertkochia sediminum]
MKETIEIIRTNTHHKDFLMLVRALDAYLAITDGDEHDFYDQFNKLDHIDCVILLYVDGIPAACGAIKPYDRDSAEIKRMFTTEACRGKRLAGKVLHALEQWAAELGFSRCILETGTRQKAAIALYERSGYRYMPCYGQYQGMENSRCFEKKLVGSS